MDSFILNNQDTKNPLFLPTIISHCETNTIIDSFWLYFWHSALFFDLWYEHKPILGIII